MRPNRIPEILDLTWKARQLGLIYNPMFVGEAGLGKTEIAQGWVRSMDDRYKDDGGFGFLDLRLAFYEGPDLRGYPETIEINGVMRQITALPEMWPTSGRGMIYIEEPNRGTSMIMNCLMQLTDKNRSIGDNYTVPEGWIIASALNPEGAKYDVNAMDPALLDRFEIFTIDYDHRSFMNYVETSGWHDNVVNFLKSNIWVYKTPDGVAKDGKYISPRTWSKMNTAEVSGSSTDESMRSLHRIICQSSLGKHVGNEYWKTCWDDAPIVATDLLTDLPKAIKKLKKDSNDGNAYAGDKVNITVDSVIESYGGFFEGRMKDDKPWEHEEGTIDELTMVEVAMIIPSDQAVNLIKGCGIKVHKGRIQSFFKDFQKRNPKCIKIMREHIKLERAVRSTQS